MGFRFRHIVRVLPGVRINLAKRGASLSLGGKGLSVNVGKKGVRTTVGLPGSGMSYSTYRSHEIPSAQEGLSARSWLWPVIGIGILIALAVFYR
jgi:hypothetical protein